MTPIAQTSLAPDAVPLMTDNNPIDVEALRPIACGNLVRLGSPNDGGYVVPLAAIEGAGALVSFGLRFDWNFEREFRRLNPTAVIHCYDHTVSERGALFFSATETLRFLTNFRPDTLRGAKTWLDYRGFFRGDVKHFRQRVWRDRNRNSVTVTDALGRVSSRVPIFLKIDIEGSEYRIMDDVVANARAIGGLAIEFHDLDVYPERFNEAVAALRQHFHVVHVHANNYADLSSFGFPGAIELTFLNKALVAQDPVISAQRYPVPGLDQPNDPATPDYEFHFRA